MRVLVLGAGLIGVATAWYLSEDGHEVTVIDRQPGAALETSFANGGQISCCHAEPWANPRVMGKVLQWLGREDSPLLWRLRLDPAQWAWGLRFLGECRAHRTRRNMLAILRLALYSRSCLQALRKNLTLEYDQLTRGILHFYTEARDFEQAIPQAALMREFGCERLVKSGAECLAIEPALQDASVPIVGGTYTAADESGDARKFTQALALKCAERGVVFMFGRGVAEVRTEKGRFAAIRLDNGEELRADACVAALGSYTPRILKSLGISIPVYPAKGYSVTIPLTPGSRAPTVSLIDDACKLVYSRLGERLRVAGTAEFTGYDTTIAMARSQTLLKRTATIFPGVAQDGAIEHWTGLRPSTPGNVPIIGATSVANLFLNTGHGTLGWTMACGSGRLLADILGGRAPEVDPAPYAARC